MRTANIGGRAAIVENGRFVDVESASGGRLSSDPMELIARLDEAAELTVPDDAPELDHSQLGPPVPRPQKILGVGINYHDHALEAGFDVPDEPCFFAKLPTAICGPADEIAIPEGRDSVDWEAELVVVIGRETKHVDVSDAWSAVAGYTCGQDISDRAEQFRALRQFTIGKSYDTYAPTGPVMVTPDEVDVESLTITCSLDGEEVQRGSTADQVFGVAELISWLSRACTLTPGDLIFTGTPVGVGYIQKPPRFLRAGSILETEIEGIGALRNPCVAGPGGRES